MTGQSNLKARLGAYKGLQSGGPSLECLLGRGEVTDRYKQSSLLL
jgi:hypothetical protein